MNGIANGLRALAAWLLVAGAPASAAALWSTTELQYQHGRLDAPSFTGGGATSTSIVTLQNATGWRHFDFFAFADILEDRRDDGFNDRDVYAEAYLASGIGTWLGHDLDLGPLRDIGPVVGINHDADAKVWKYLPGVRLYWQLPGLAFLNTDITAYLDGNRGVAHGGAPREGDSWMVDVSWAYPFEAGGQRFSIEGHVEYIDGRRDAFGGRVASWLLAQPQVRWDAGNALFDLPDRLFVGVEWQLWRNKLGDPATDENAVQLVAVWRL